MPILTPITLTKISTTGWGIPITNEVNRLTTHTVATPQYFATTTARDAYSSALRTIGMIAVVGTPAGTGTSMPRIYVWDGAVWKIVGWYGTTGRVGFHLTRVAMPVASLAGTDITGYTETHDPDNWYPGSGATVTVPAGMAGLYHINGNVQWSSSSLGPNVAAVLNIAGGSYAASGGVSLYGIHHMNALYNLTAGQTIKIAVYQDSGAGVTCTVNFHAYMLSPA